MAPSRDSEPSTTPNPQKENGQDTSPPTTSSLWRVESIPGKGKGLLANQTITPGTLILSEPPLLTTSCITSSDAAGIEKDIGRKLKTLTKTQQRDFLTLHNNFPEEKFPWQNTIRSNGYPLGPNSEVGGIFATISRINHSCLPNAVHSWNASRGEDGEETVYAVRPIKEGEEITLSYHAGGPSSSRKALLLEHFRFTCTCELCSLPSPQLQKSDARLIRAQSLDEAIGDGRSPAEKLLKNCKSLMEIFQEEGIKDDRVSRLWYDAFQICNGEWDEARASVFAERYCEAKVISAGKGCVDEREMRPVVKEPRKHSSYGKRGKWKTKVSDIPKSLGEEEFEKWLWRL